MGDVDTLHAYLGFAIMFVGIVVAGLLVCFTEEAEDGEKEEAR